jgi:universal stress protein E
MKRAAWKQLLVVITDPFASEQPALRKAAALARRMRCHLHLFNTFMLPEPLNDVAMDAHHDIVAAAIRHRREQILQLARRLRLDDVECVVTWDFPIHEAIVREVIKTKADLVITDSHRHGRLARLILTNTDWELMRTCPCPVWFVRSASLPKRPKLLVAVDPRHTGEKPAQLDDRLLGVASQLTGAVDGTISVVHAYQTPEQVTPGILRKPVRNPASRSALEFADDTARLVDSLCRKHAIGPKQCIVQEGRTRDVVAAAAQQRSADVLIMGVVSRSLLPRPVIGGTAESVIDHVDCDVFVVKPLGFTTPVKKERGR